MKFKYELGLALGVLVLGISANVVSGQSAAGKCTSEACACENALAQNTVEALEAFLRKYPQSVKGTSACAALAVPLDDGGVAPDGQTRDDDGTTVEPMAPTEG